MSSEPALDRPNLRHRLAVALRFVDAFTATEVGSPISVSVATLPVVKGMPNTPWRAVRGPNDNSYRFVVTNNTVTPMATVAVDVNVPTGEYVNYEPITVDLPRTLVAHPPTPDRSDFLIERPLWPTRLLKVLPGETAIIGNVLNSTNQPVPRLRLKIWPSGGPMPTFPYAYTDDAGDFLIRLPGLKGSVSGGVVTSTASLALDIRQPPTYAAQVVPIAPPIPFTVVLGQIATLSISVP